MNAIVDGKVFKSGDSFAVMLPDEAALALGSDVQIEYRGDEVIIRSKAHATPDWRDVSPEEALARNRALVEEIRAIWAAHGGPPPAPQKRDSDIFPDRPGLY